MVDSKKQAEQYIKQQKNKLNGIKQEWEQKTYDADLKLVSAVISGLSFEPNRSHGYDADSSYRYSSASFRPTIDSSNVQKYMTEFTGWISRMIDSVTESVKDIDKHLDGFCSAGLDANVIQQLIALLFNWVDYFKNMNFSMRGQSVSVVVPDEIIAIEKKWKRHQNKGRKKAEDEKKIAEAAKYGVSVKNLEVHKLYLEAKQKKEKAKTSTAMQRAVDALRSVGEYLDAQELAADAESSVGELRQQEEADRKEKGPVSSSSPSR